MNGIDATVDAWVRPLSDALAGVVFFKLPLFGAEVPAVVLWLVVGSVFFTLRFRFVNLRFFGEALRLVRRPLADHHPGEVSHFQALSAALSGTVGVGNIGGVAVAISVGGPGAAFWMIVAGILGMSTKFVECTLSVIYRRENADGSVSGGPMYFLERGFGERGLPRLGKALGVFYAGGIVVGCMGIGNMFQSNQVFAQLVRVTGGEVSWFADKGWLVGSILAGLVGLVVLGGIKSIARVTERLVPFMAMLYLVAAGMVLILNAEALPWVYARMLQEAFTSDGIAGGALGALIVGFQRALFSNEAGIGSASIAHAAVHTDEPLTEGFVSLLEPFIDTVIICHASALVVLTTMYFEPNFAAGLGGIEITSAAFGRALIWSPPILALAAALFALSTMIAWSYYGLKGWTYLVGESLRARHGFNFVFCLFVALGCVLDLEAVLEFSDALVFLICVPNLIGLYVLTPVVAQRLRAYVRDTGAK